MLENPPSPHLSCGCYGFELLRVDTVDFLKPFVSSVAQCSHWELQNRVKLAWCMLIRSEKTYYLLSQTGSQWAVMLQGGFGGILQECGLNLAAFVACQT